MTSFVALLRAVNVTGRNKIPMAELRKLCDNLGFSAVQTYIQSGNLVLSSPGNASSVENSLENGIATRFGLSIPVIARTADQWLGYLRTNPFPAAAQHEPNHLLMGLSKSRPAANAADALRERAAAGEEIELIGDVLWVFYALGIARSKLSPALIDRLVGSSVTARNWTTVQRLAAML